MAQLQAIKGLDSLMDGALNERFTKEFDRVLANVFDPNTDPKAKRTITISIDVMPSDDRTQASFRGRVVTKLAASVPITKPIYLEQGENGTFKATEMTHQVPGQIGMDGHVNMPNVVKFNQQG